MAQTEAKKNTLLILKLNFFSEIINCYHGYRSAKYASSLNLNVIPIKESNEKIS